MLCHLTDLVDETPSEAPSKTKVRGSLTCLPGLDTGMRCLSKDLVGETPPDAAPPVEVRGSSISPLGLGTRMGPQLCNFVDEKPAEVVFDENSESSSAP